MSKTAVTGSLLSFEVDRQSELPVYLQLSRRLAEAVESGRLASGTKLPSTRALADEMGVARNTVVQAFEVLTSEGVLESRVGAGTFVCVSATAHVDTPSAIDTHSIEAIGRPYPFRSLSRRGRALVASATGEFAERPRSFMPDVPDLREFPIKTWLRLLGETSGRLTGEILAETSNAGYEPLRRAISQHLGAARGTQCDWTQVIITTGSQQSLDLTCRLLVDPGDSVWVEEPCYVGARAVFRANACSISPVPVDEHGMRVEEAIQTQPAPKIIYVTAARQYPLGMTLSRPRREALLEYARVGGSWVVEDDYDHEFQYSGHTFQAVHGMDRSQRTILIGTFSKILLPSFRLGYVVVPKDLVDSFAKARAVLDRHAPLIEQMVLSEFMHRGLLVSHIRKMRRLYRERQGHLISGLSAMLGRDLRFDHTETGLHLVLAFRSDGDDIAFSRHAATLGVTVRPLSPYYAAPSGNRGILLGFSAFNQAEMRVGFERLSMLRSELRRQIGVET